MEATTSRKYKVLGTTDCSPSGGCMCCGRMDLKVYIALEPLAGGPDVFMGTTCGAKAERVTVKEFRNEIKAADEAARKAAADERRAAAAIEDEAFAAWILTTYGVTISQPSDLWNKVEGETPLSLRKAWRAAR